MNTNQFSQKLVIVLVSVLVLAIVGAAVVYVLGLNKNPGNTSNTTYATSSVYSELSFKDVGAEDTVNSLDAHLNSQLSSEESIQQLDLEAEFGL